MTERGLYPHQRTVSTGESTVWVGEQPGEGPAIVLLHGYPDDSTIYDRLTPHLAGRRVIAIDFSGYGLAPREDRPWIAGRRETEVMQVLGDLELADVVLVGHDASVPVAVNVTLDHPDRVSRLVLLNGFFHSDPELRLPDMIRLFGTLQLEHLSDALMEDPKLREWLLGYSGTQFGIDAGAPGNVAANSIIPQYFGSAEHPDARHAIREWTATLYPTLAHNDERVAAGDLEGSSTPVVVAFGQDDPFLTETIAANIAGLFPNATISTIADSTHWPQWDQPERVAEVITAS